MRVPGVFLLLLIPRLSNGETKTGGLRDSNGDQDHPGPGSQFAGTVILGPTSGDRTGQTAAEGLLGGIRELKSGIKDGLRLSIRPTFIKHIGDTVSELTQGIPRFTPLVSSMSSAAFKGASSTLRLHISSLGSAPSSLRSNLLPSLASKLKSDSSSILSNVPTAPRIRPAVVLPIVTSKLKSELDKIVSTAVSTSRPTLLTGVASRPGQRPRPTPIIPSTPFPAGILSGIASNLKPNIAKTMPGIQPTPISGLFQSVTMALKPLVESNKAFGQTVNLLQNFLNRVKEVKNNMKIKNNLLKSTNGAGETPNFLGTTVLPITEPLGTESPVREPPGTEPLVTEPTITEPPTKDSPAVESVTEPLSMEILDVESSTTEPSITKSPRMDPPPAAELAGMEPPSTEFPPTEPPATDQQPPSAPPPALSSCPAAHVLVPSTRFSATKLTEQLHSIHWTETTLYVTKSRLKLYPTTVRQTVTKHPLGTLYKATEFLPLTQYLVRTRTLLRTRYRTVTDHLSVTDTVNHYITETVTLPRPITVTLLSTSVRTLHQAGTSLTTVTRRTTATRTVVRTSTAHVQSTAVVTARRTERVTETRDVPSTLPAHTVTRTFIYCPPDERG